MSDMLPARHEVEWVQCGLLEHHVLGTRFQAEHLHWVHQPAAVAPVLGKEQLETGVHQRRCALIDDSIGVDLGAWMAESAPLTRAPWRRLSGIWPKATNRML